MDPAMQGVIVGGSIAIVSSVVGAYVNHRLELRRMKAKEEQEEAKRLRLQLLDTRRRPTMMPTMMRPEMEAERLMRKVTSPPTTQEIELLERQLLEEQLAVGIQLLEQIKDNWVTDQNATVEQALQKARKQAGADAEKLGDGCCRRCGTLETLGSKYCRTCGERYDEAETGTES